MWSHFFFLFNGSTALPLFAQPYGSQSKKEDVIFYFPHFFFFGMDKRERFSSLPLIHIPPFLLLVFLFVCCCWANPTRSIICQPLKKLILSKSLKILTFCKTYVIYVLLFCFASSAFFFKCCFPGTMLKIKTKTKKCIKKRMNYRFLS